MCQQKCSVFFLFLGGWGIPLFGSEKNWPPHDCLWAPILKFWLGALIPRAVCLFVLQKMQQKYKTIQTLTKHNKAIQNLWKMAMETIKEASEVGRGFLDIFFILLYNKQIKTRAWYLYKFSFGRVTPILWLKKYVFWFSSISTFSLHSTS